MGLAELGRYAAAPKTAPVRRVNAQMTLVDSNSTGFDSIGLELVWGDVFYLGRSFVQC